MSTPNRVPDVCLHVGAILAQASRQTHFWRPTRYQSGPGGLQTRALTASVEQRVSGSVEIPGRQ